MSEGIRNYPRPKKFISILPKRNAIPKHSWFQYPADDQYLPNSPAGLQ